MLIRRELASDVTAVRDVVTAAFAQPDSDETPAETRLVEMLRDSAEWVPELALVADAGASPASGASVVGHVVCSRAWVGDRPALGLGPLAVVPAAQGRGIGSALMHAVLGAADALGEPLVVLLGHEAYYPRFGFRPALELGVEPPVAAWGAHFQARPLTAYDVSLRGPFRYAPAFDSV